MVNREHTIVPGLSETLDRIFRTAGEHKATDVHLRPGEPARFRVAGQLLIARAALITEAELLALLQFAPHMKAADLSTHLDFSFSMPQVGRLRVHLFRQRGVPSAVVRVVPDHVPTLQELRLPGALRQLTDTPQGLILITGATGMGKSTTLASLLHRVIQEKAIHIVTIEDPIEYELASERSAVTQREVGRDVTDYRDGLKAAMREDPDVIMVGEIRDVETLRETLLAAESGHLVMSSVHTRDMPSTITKLAAMFPSEEQAVARTRLADALVGVLSQVLLPMKGSTARIVVTELMIATPLVRERIREGVKGPALVEAMERGRGEGGMHTFDDSVVALVKANLLDPEVGKHAVRSPADLLRRLRVDGNV